MRNPALKILNLSTSFKIKEQHYAAVDDVTLTVYENEVLAIVGESGCGKSALALSIMGLHSKERTKLVGEVTYNEQNLLTLTDANLNKIRGNDIGMIFQDPLTALNPLVRIGKQIEESMKYHTQYSGRQRKKRTLELLGKVGIPNVERVYKQYPHELSGGMRQRVVIAIALSCEPKLLIADEPTTALDVTIQAQIMDLMKTLQQDTKAGIILITHDLGVVAEMADRVAVMYAGQIVEVANVDTILKHPLHPYTRSLLNSIPSNFLNKGRLHVIDGVVPSIQNLNRTGCRFAPRIDWIKAEEHQDHPVLEEVEPNHWVRCSCYRNFYFPEGKTGDQQYVLT